jgi:hypothetical protein
MFDINKYKILKKLLTVMVFVLAQTVFSQNFSCDFATPFTDNNCVFFSPSTPGPLTNCYSFLSPGDSVDFNFTSYGPLGDCEDVIEYYTLYTNECDSITTNTDGLFAGLIPDIYYVVCYTVQCPTTGVINLLCTQEILILPIELLYFNARVEFNSIRLMWGTASEDNNASFTIYRSNNLVDWVDMGSVEGSGNSTQEIAYHIICDTPIEGVNYFKLTQTDYDGNITTFNIIAVVFTKKIIAYDIFERYNILGQQIKTNQPTK